MMDENIFTLFLRQVAVNLFCVGMVEFRGGVLRVHFMRITMELLLT